MQWLRGEERKKGGKGREGGGEERSVKGGKDVLGRGIGGGTLE